MQSHRQAPSSLHLWVLAWLLMSLGSAIASPLVQPKGFVLVCSGAKKTLQLIHLQDGHLRTDAPALDCPLCVLTDAVPPAAGSRSLAPPMTVSAVPWRAETLPLLHAHHRPPARAPPVFS